MAAPELRLLVCGSRDYTNAERVTQVLSSLPRPAVLITGQAPGADRLAEEWATSQRIRIIPFPADWAKYGRAAGPLRNRAMVRDGKPTLVVAFPRDPQAISPGTQDMITVARAAGIPTYVMQ
jgi:hypothetical protein